jgi:RNA polymerase sigma factor (sigma-70 family)
MQPEQNSFLEALYYKNFGKLTIYARAVLGDATQAQEIVQDVFYEAVLHIDTLIVHKNPDGWLMQTEKNKIRESRRAYARHIRRFISLDSENSPEIASFDEPAAETARSNYTAAVQKIEQALSPEELHLLKRFIFDHASHMETAEEFDITVWASQKRLERVRKKLFEIFPEWKEKKKKGRK